MTVKFEECTLKPLDEEANMYFKLSQEYKLSHYLNNQCGVYLINKQFLNKWKKFVNYSNFKNHLKKSLINDGSLLKINYSLRNNSEHPGPINNTQLLVPLSEFFNDNDEENPDNIIVKNHLNYLNYKKLDENLWKFFYIRYGGGPMIYKKVLSVKGDNIYQSIVLFEMKIDLILVDKRIEIFLVEEINKLCIKPLYISKSLTLKDLKEKIIKIINYTTNNIEKQDIRLWKMNGKLIDLKRILKQNQEEILINKLISFTNSIPIQNSSKTAISDINFDQKDILVVEVALNGDFIFEVINNNLNYQSDPEIKNTEYQDYSMVKAYNTENNVNKVINIDDMTNNNSIKNDSKKTDEEFNESYLINFQDSKSGLVGLKNLGNTCFMNTALQCISNCKELSRYFLERLYKNHINYDNPLGTKGVLANAYRELLLNLWNSKNKVFSPLMFKKVIQNFQSIFTGHQQHDSHDFLNYLLDALHEDLNKVIKKPFIENEEINLPDDVKSRDSWIKFLRRNQSLLVDLFYGQFKSTLYCPDESCRNISSTYDQFLSISLPIVAYVNPYTIECFFIFYDMSIKTLGLEIPFTTNCTVMAFRNKISALLNIHPFSFVIAKLDSMICFDYIVDSNSLLRNNSNEKKRILLIQINPEYFYSEDNKYFLKEKKFKNQNFSKKADDTLNSKIVDQIFSEDYEENDEGQTKEDICYYSFNGIKSKQNDLVKINFDHNYGFNSFINIVLLVKCYSDGSLSTSNRNRVIYPRMIFLNKEFSCKDIHFIIFQYFLPILKDFNNKINTKYKDNQELTEEDLFNEFFKDISTNRKLDTVEIQNKMNFPYRIRIKNRDPGTYYNCIHCNEKYCNDCLLPFSETITLNDLLQRFPKNNNLDLDNTYLYLKENQRQSSIRNRDFSLEITFLSKYQKSLKTLDEYNRVTNFPVKSLSSKVVNIYDCFKNFSKLEILKEHNEWYCGSCKNHTKAKKKMDIYKLPDVLILQLKRFDKNTKICSLIDFPIYNLDLTNCIKNNSSESSIYDLFAVCNHEGNLEGGHYYAYCKNFVNGEWFEFNDSSVKKIQEEKLVTSSAYIMLYRRKNLETLINLKDLYIKPFEEY